MPGIDGGVVMLGVRTSKMRKASMTELIEIMFWFGSERNVRWSDDSRREYEWSQRKGGLHDYQIKYASTRQGDCWQTPLGF